MKAATRTISFFTTWLAEIVRQPLLIALLLLGPFVILLGFGSGVDVTGRKPDVIVVRTGDGSQALEPLPAEINDYVNVVDETTDLTAAVRKVQDGDVDAVAVIPPDPAGTVMGGERIPIQIFMSEIDPLTERFTEAYLLDQVAQLNHQTLAEAISQAQASVDEIEGYVATAREYVAIARAAEDDIGTVQEQLALLRDVLVPLQESADAVSDAARGVTFVLPGIGRPTEQLESFQSELDELVDSVSNLERQVGSVSGDEGTDVGTRLDEIDATLDGIEQRARELQAIPPEVLSAPFQLVLENVAPFEPDFTGFYSPAVLVLLLQHLGISLAALSLTRIRVLGLTSMLRVAPIRAIEIVNGQYLSYGLAIGLTGAAILSIMYWGLGVPIFGSLLYLACTIGLLIGFSLGIGFVVALMTSSEQQASQVAMLVLLAAVFFSGLVVAVERLSWPVRAISLALPSTYATRTAQDLMLRGTIRHPEDLLVLGAGAVCLYLATVFLLRRRLAPA